MKTIVLGAGLSGLAAARQLAAGGDEVVVIDKGRGIGGRLATRRIGDAVLDHGAQFFTVRGNDFAHVVTAARDAGVVGVWCLGFGIEDGYERYYCPDGMTALAKWMAADLEVQVGTEARALTSSDMVRFVDDAGRVLAEGGRAVITAPIPQTIALFDHGAVKLGREIAHQLKAVDYFATLALLVVVDGEPNVDEPGGMQLNEGPFTFIADNLRKGVSRVRALTFHAAHDYSSRRFDDDPAQVEAELLDRAAPWIGNATVVESQLKKWRYAGPVSPLPERTLIVDSPGGPIALAGDAFGGPKVEGAFNSGVAAARALLAR